MVQKLIILSGLIMSATCMFLHPAPVPILLEQIREPPVSYDFSYHVNDANTGDFKAQSEARRGDTVLGQYSLIQPDGIRRVVDYQANDLTGFQATVNNQPLVEALQLSRTQNNEQENQVAQDTQRQQQDLQQQQHREQQIQQQHQQEQQQLQQQYQQEQQQLQQQYQQQQQQQQLQQQQQHQQQQLQQRQQQQLVQQQQQLQQQYQEEASRATTPASGVSVESGCPGCQSSTPPSISLSTVLHPYQNNPWY